jgi:hypothetical protein
MIQISDNRRQFEGSLIAESEKRLNVGIRVEARDEDFEQVDPPGPISAALARAL